MANRLACWIGIAAVGILVLVPPVAAGSCDSIASLALPDGKITSATLVAAGTFTPPVGGGPMMGGPGGTFGF